MKRILLILFMLLVLLFSSFAAVKYNDLGGGKYSVTLTYKNDTANQIYMIGSWQSWTEPGIPMTKNADGLWEITIPMDKPKILYKFYNPELEGDKYVEDPEADEAVANPFGTKDAVLRRPRKANKNGKVEQTEWNPIFSLYSRNYFYQNVWSNLTINTDNNTYARVQPDRAKDPTTDQDISWEGEYGTTKGNIARVRYGKGYMFFNNTAKFHGNIFKHMTVDVEVNTQGRYDWDFETYWDATTDVARTRKLQELVRGNGAKIVDMFFGALTATNFDQLVFGWTTKNFDAYLGAKNCKNINSKDPMLLVNGSKVGDKDSGAHNVEVLIHPAKVKGLNINLGVSKSNPSTRRYMMYLDASYNILKQNKYTVGALYYMAAYTPASIGALDSFVNAVHAMSLWTVLKPVKGLSIKAQGALQLPTRYFDSYYGSDGAFHTLTENDANDNYKKTRVGISGFDFVANSAAYLRVGYVHKIFNIAYKFSGGGSQFTGELAKKGSPFSQELDTGFERNVTGEPNNLEYALPYMNMYSSDGYNGAQINNNLKFNITPIPGKKDLLKISFADTFVVGKLEAFSARSNPVYAESENTTDGTGPDGYQANRYQLDNVFDIGLQTKFKINSMNMLISARALFSLTVYNSDAMNYYVAKASEQITPTPGIYFTFNRAELNIKLDNISKVFKSIGINYQLMFDYYPGFYSTNIGEHSISKRNHINWRKLFNQVIVDAKFSHDISVSLGFIARLYHGSGENDSDDRWVFWGQKAFDAVSDYFSFGLAMGLTYVIPVKVLHTPLFYVNFSIGWDPFRDATFGEEYQTLQANVPEFGVGEASSTEKAKQNNIDLEESILTIGLKWDF